MIEYRPKELLRRIAPKSKIENMLKGNVTLKKTALNFIDAAAEKGIGVIDKASVADVALRTVRAYQERIAKASVDANFDRSAGTQKKDEILDDPRQLIQRVENEVLSQVSAGIKEQYGDEIAEWLPSDAEEPDPEHSLNYGKLFKISEGINGEIPGERYGCKCGMNILVKQTKLELE